MLRFPQDHGAHPAFRDEWWYFTGNVSDSLGREYGFELTFFRIALTPAAPQRTSAWGANQVWMANFALTDAAGRRFFASERRARGALGLAGGTGATPLRIWVEDWSAKARRTGARSGCGCGRPTGTAHWISISNRRGRPCRKATAVSMQKVRNPATRRITTRCRTSQRIARARGSAHRGARTRLVRPRVEHERAQRRRGRLGLVRAASIRR